MRNFPSKLITRISRYYNTVLNMSRIRYFPNPAANFKPQIGVKIPDDQIKALLFETLAKISTHFKPTERHGEDGLYLGSGGVSYMYYHLSKIPALQNYREQFLISAVNYLNPALEVCRKQEHHIKDLPSFLLGNGGVYAVAVAIFTAIKDFEQSIKYKELYEKAGDICKQEKFLNCGCNELFVGRAGYICGALWLAKETKSPLKIENLYELCRLMIDSGRHYSRQYRSPSPLMYAYYDVEYLGAGHGLCSILQYVMSVPGYLELNPKDARDIKESVDYLLSLQDEEGNFPTAMDELGQRRNELVHWCHGAGGVVYMLAKAYLIWKDEKYLRSCEKAANLIWEKGLLRKGPGLCHGVAGNGYVFLLMYRLTYDEKYLHRALMFYRFMLTDDFQHKARTPDNPYSLYEGLAGTACFLGDLLNTQEASFPFSDVF